MESQPQNPKFRNNPENFHPWAHCIKPDRRIQYNAIQYKISLATKHSAMLIANKVFKCIHQIHQHTKR